MDIIYLSMNMAREYSLSICKVGYLFFLNLICYPCVLNHRNHFSGEAESGLERLHQCAEKELQTYLNSEGPSKDFNEFRTKLAGLTRFLVLPLLSFSPLLAGYSTLTYKTCPVVRIF